MNLEATVAMQPCALLFTIYAVGSCCCCCCCTQVTEQQQVQAAAAVALQHQQQQEAGVGVVTAAATVDTGSVSQPAAAAVAPSSSAAQAQQQQEQQDKAEGIVGAPAATPVGASGTSSAAAIVSSSSSSITSRLVAGMRQAIADAIRTGEVTAAAAAILQAAAAGAPKRPLTVLLPEQLGMNAAAAVSAEGAQKQELTVAESFCCWQQLANSRDFQYGDQLWDDCVAMVSELLKMQVDSESLATSVLGDPRSVFEQFLDDFTAGTRIGSFVFGTAGLRGLAESILGQLEDISQQLGKPFRVDVSHKAPEFFINKGEVPYATQTSQLVMPMGQGHNFTDEEWSGSNKYHVQYQGGVLTRATPMDYFGKHLTPATRIMRLQVSVYLSEQYEAGSKQDWLLKLQQELDTYVAMALPCMLRYMLPWQLPSAVGAELCTNTGSMCPLAHMPPQYSGELRGLGTTLTASFADLLRK